MHPARTTLQALLLAATLALPAAAQQISPMTGTTASPSPTTTTTPTPNTPPNSAPRQARRTFRQRFDDANTTHDGKLTLDQAKAARLTRVATNFDAIDTARKGYVTLPDIQAYNRAHRRRRPPAAATQ